MWSLGSVSKDRPNKWSYNKSDIGSTKSVLAIYGKKDFSGSLDELRCHLFQNKKGDLRSLPPTEDAFALHLTRALFQTIIWKRATLPDLGLPQYTDYGRSIEKGLLLAKQMTKNAKPNTKKSCICQKTMCGQRCPCRQGKRKCTLACLCCVEPSKCTWTTERVDWH